MLNVPLDTKQVIPGMLFSDNLLASTENYTTLHPFNGPFPRSTWVSWQQKGKPFWILMKQEMMGWQWHQLDHMQIICTLLPRD